MGIDVLGPVRVETASLHPRERSLLAALTVRHGTPIAPEELAEVLWPADARPATWNKQVAQSVSALRKVIGAERVVTTVSGYHLDVDPEEVDARRFEALVARACFSKPDASDFFGREAEITAATTHVSDLGEYRETCDVPDG